MSPSDYDAGEWVLGTVCSDEEWFNLMTSL